MARAGGRPRNWHREQSDLVQRAIQRLHDGIARREMNLDLEAIKVVLVEMATQKERADRLAKELAEVRADRCGCTETYPQLVPGKVSHGPGCPNR